MSEIASSSEIGLDTTDASTAVQSLSVVQSSVQTWQAGIIFGKAFVGVGWLAVSYGFSKVGVIGGLLVGLLVVAFVTKGLTVHTICFFHKFDSQKLDYLLPGSPRRLL